MKYFPVVSPCLTLRASEACSLRAKWTRYIPVCCTLLITIPEPNWDIFLLMRVFTVCVAVYYYGHGARAYINECYHGYLAIL